MSMKKILVMGCPGSGKSTFSRKLAAITGLPLVPLDSIWWQPDRTHLTIEQFNPILQKELEKDTWIIDGNYPPSAQMRLKYCDTVLMMDYPLELCIQGILDRRGKPRPDMPFAEAFEDDEFLAYVRDYHENLHPRILQWIEESRDHADIITFYNRQEAEDFLTRLQQTSKGEENK